jgi:hypothetical protein
MKYTKPIMTLINSAAVEIQGMPKQGTVEDLPPSNLTHVTTNAYEADE